MSDIKDEYTVTVVVRITADTEEEALNEARKTFHIDTGTVGIYQAPKMSAKNTTVCRACHHPRGKERHDRDGVGDDGCSCYH